MAKVNFKFFVECKKSKDKGTLYRVLQCDFGYRVAQITMEQDVISEMLGIPISSLYAMKEGDRIPVTFQNA